MQTRQNPRKVLTVPGSYSTDSGTPVNVTLRDLSRSGCRLAVGEDKLGIGSRIEIMIAERGPYTAKVKWCARGDCGVTFKVPLRPELFASFKNSHIADFSDDIAPGSVGAMPVTGGRRFC